MALNMRNVVPDRSHEMECLRVVRDGDGYAAGMCAGIGGQEASAWTLLFGKKEHEAVECFNHWRGNGVCSGKTPWRRVQQSPNGTDSDCVKRVCRRVAVELTARIGKAQGA